VIQWPVVVSGNSSIHERKSLESMTFENDSRLKRIRESMYGCSRVHVCSVSRELTRGKVEKLERVISRP
jgi:hypothetical protein